MRLFGGLDCAASHKLPGTSARIQDSLVGLIGTMKQLFQAFTQLSRRRKLVVGVIVIIVILTWLAVCLVLALPAS
jgi:hypothetical protein